MQAYSYAFLEQQVMDWNVSLSAIVTRQFPIEIEDSVTISTWALVRQLIYSVSVLKQITFISEKNYCESNQLEFSDLLPTF